MDKINGAIMKGMLESACNNLNNHKKDVDALNVFPVPDGDTGTNMSLTFTNGMAEVVKSGSESLPVVTKPLSRGLLMGDFPRIQSIGGRKGRIEREGFQRCDGERLKACL